jgi:PAS domain S-box-containing protein
MGEHPERLGACADARRAHRDEIGATTLAKARTELIAIIESLPELVIIRHAERIVYVNSAVVAALGFDNNEAIVGQKILDFFRPDERADIAPLMDAHIMPEGALAKHRQLRKKDGDYITVAIRALQEIEFGGNPCLLLIGQDITDTIKTELEVRQSQKLEAVGQLAAGIAHELNTPIQFISDNVAFLRESFVGMLEVLAKYNEFQTQAASHDFAPELRAEIDAIKQAVDLDFVLGETTAACERAIDGTARVSKIVQAMKEFSHPGGSGHARIALNRIIDNALIVSRNEYKYVATVETAFADDLPFIWANAGELGQVFLNLIVNAAHAITDAARGTALGKITITTRQDGDALVVEIGDTGTGIPREIQRRVFDPFFTTKEVGRGTGQGLAIARNIVEKKHGGSLSFTTEVGRGTTFNIRLPMGADELEG